MIDRNGKNEFFIEANWKPDDEATNECKILKFTFPNRDVAYIKREDLHQIMFACGTAEQQRKLIPQKITRIRNYETMLGIKAKNDIRKGEMINVHVKIPLPKMEEEIIGEIKSMAKDGRLKKIGDIPIIG